MNDIDISNMDISISHILSTNKYLHSAFITYKHSNNILNIKQCWRELVVKKKKKHKTTFRIRFKSVFTWGEKNYYN